MSKMGRIGERTLPRTVGVRGGVGLTAARNEHAKAATTVEMKRAFQQRVIRGLATQRVPATRARAGRSRRQRGGAARGAAAASVPGG